MVILLLVWYGQDGYRYRNQAVRKMSLVGVWLYYCWYGYGDWYGMTRMVTDTDSSPCNEKLLRKRNKMVRKFIED